MRRSERAALRLSLWESWHRAAMTERASRLSQSCCAAISRLFVRAMLSLCQCFSGSILALSVCFAATSPKGRGTGVPVRPTRDEQSLHCPKTVVPCGLAPQQLDKVLLSRSRCPRKRGPLFCALSGLGRPVQSGPARQWLPLWGSWREAPERACRCRGNWRANARLRGRSRCRRTKNSSNRRKRMKYQKFPANPSKHFLNEESWIFPLRQRKSVTIAADAALGSAAHGEEGNERNRSGRSAVRTFEDVFVPRRRHVLEKKERRTSL